MEYFAIVNGLVIELNSKAGINHNIKVCELLAVKHGAKLFTIYRGAKVVYEGEN